MPTAPAKQFLTRNSANVSSSCIETVLTLPAAPERWGNIIAADRTETAPRASPRRRRGADPSQAEIFIAALRDALDEHREAQT